MSPPSVAYLRARYPQTPMRRRPGHRTTPAHQKALSGRRRRGWPGEDEERWEVADLHAWCAPCGMYRVGVISRGRHEEFGRV